MIRTDVLIVGGGPSGSACAWRLRQAGMDCLILDQHAFPRVKPCAGWLTPEILTDLAFSPSDYPHGFTTFRSFQVSIRGFTFKLPTHQHAIRRVEFDDWLLRRSGAEFRQHTVKNITPTGDGYEVDGQFYARYLVGAGGTYCPVYRTLFKKDNPKDRQHLIVATEQEFPYDYTDDRCWLWFFEDRLPGYAWYVPKANGILNVGVGGKAEQLNANGDNLKNHWNRLVEKLDRMGLVRGHTYEPEAHSYYVRLKLPQVRKGNAFLVGDSAGLATLDMGEGIRPAVQSGLLAAESILKDRPYRLDAIPKYSFRSLLRLR
mgnify:CR=1 FL=1